MAPRCLQDTCKNCARHAPPLGTPSCSWRAASDPPRSLRGTAPRPPIPADAQRARRGRRVWPPLQVLPPPSCGTRRGRCGLSPTPRPRRRRFGLPPSRPRSGLPRGPGRSRGCRSAPHRRPLPRSRAWPSPPQATDSCQCADGTPPKCAGLPRGPPAIQALPECHHASCSACRACRRCRCPHHLPQNSSWIPG